MKVLNAEPSGYSEKAVNLWKEAGYDYKPSSWQEIDGTNSFPEVNVLIVRLAKYIDRAILKKFVNLRTLISATTGLDHLDMHELKQRDIRVLCLRGEDDFLNSIPSTAEHTWGLILALVRNIPQANDHVRSGLWDRDSFKGYQLKDKTLGIIGMGRTGSKVASYARAFGMKTYYYDPFVSEYSDKLKCENLRQLLEASDILSIHVHLSDHTRQLLNSNNIPFLKPGAFLINTSRGGVWDEQVLVEWMAKGLIRGVATDVLVGELNGVQDSDLWKAQQQGANVIITPHLGGATWDAMRASEEYICRLALSKRK